MEAFELASHFILLESCREVVLNIYWLYNLPPSFGPLLDPQNPFSQFSIYTEIAIMCLLHVCFSGAHLCVCTLQSDCACVSTAECACNTVLRIRVFVSLLCSLSVVYL